MLLSSGLTANPHPTVKCILSGFRENQCGYSAIGRNSPNWDFETDEQGKCVVLLGSFNGYENKEGMPGWGMYALVVDRGAGDAGAVSQRFIFEKNEEASQQKAQRWRTSGMNRSRSKTEPFELRLTIVRGLTLEGRILDYWHPDKPLAGIKVMSNNDLHCESHTGRGGEILEETVVTDKDGRFRLQVLGSEALLRWCR